MREEMARDPRVFLSGMQTNIAAVYRALDVYISAARFEPFGLAIVEAMAAGLPLILTRTEGPREFVHDPRVRWTEPHDEGALADGRVGLAVGELVDQQDGRHQQRVAHARDRRHVVQALPLHVVGAEHGAARRIAQRGEDEVE